jgi:hypothetical protein
VFRDDCEQQIITNIRTCEGALRTAALAGAPSKGDTDRILLSTERIWLKGLREATHYWLQVAQALHFQSVAFEKRDIPHMPHSVIFVEFDGLLTFNYPIPITHSHLGEEFHGKETTAYRGVLILDIGGLYHAAWMEPPIRDSDKSWHDVYAISWTKESWPQRLSAELTDHKFQEGMEDAKTRVACRRSDAHANRLFRMTVNLLYFLSAENHVVLRVRPEHHHMGITRGLPKSARPYYILPTQSQHIRYMMGVGEGTGSSHSYRYDVKGHFRHLTDERYERNDDGTVRLIWIEPHQRGLDNAEYRAPLRVGKVSRQVLEYDRYVRSLEDRLRRRRVSA